MSLTLIGDSKQTLYLFRNANPDILEKMDKILGDVQEGCILKNYRSPKQLVLLSNYFSEIFEGELEVHNSIPFRDVEDSVLNINNFDSIVSESSFVSKEIAALRETKIPLKDIAILARTNRQLLDFEAGLISEKIPYIIKFDSRSVMNQSSFKFLYSIYSIMFNQKDINAFCEIILPIKGIGVKFIEEVRGKVLYLIRKNPLFSIFKDINIVSMGKNTKQYQMLFNFIEEVLKPLHNFFKTPTMNFPAFNLKAREVLDYCECEGENKYDVIARLTIDRDSFFRAFSTLSKIYSISSEDFEFKVLNDFEKFVKIYEMLQLSQEAYMDYRSGKSEGGKSAVMLSTIHSYKGKEAPYIFVVCLRSYKDVNENSFEDQCVMYVAITRAKRKLYLSSSNLIRSFKGDLILAGQNPFIERYKKGISRMKEELENG